MGEGIASGADNSWLASCPINLNPAVGTWLWLELKTPQNLIVISETAILEWTASDFSYRGERLGSF